MTEEILVNSLYQVVLNLIPFLINVIGWAASSIPANRLPLDQISTFDFNSLIP